MPWINGNFRSHSLLDELDAQLERTALELLRGRGQGATVSLAELAVAVAGEDWLALLRRARLVAVRLAARDIVDLIAGYRTLSMDETHAGELKMRLKPEMEALLPVVGSA